MNRFGQALGEVIANSGKSLRETATEWGWVHSHLSRVISGRLPPKTTTVARACRQFDSATAKSLIECYLSDERDRIQADLVRLRRD